MWYKYFIKWNILILKQHMTISIIRLTDFQTIFDSELSFMIFSQVTK